MFKFERIAVRPWEALKESVVILSFEINSDQIVVERQIYTILDFLSDIGGFLSIIMGGISILLSKWNFKSFEYHFLTNFFKMKLSKANKNDE